MELRALNTAGMEEALVVLERLRSGELQRVPDAFLQDPDLTSVVGRRIDRPKANEISTRWEFGVWLYQRLEGAVSERSLFESTGMWTWLAFFLFDTIAPDTPDGRNIAKDPVKYVLNRGDYRKSYRHLVSGPYFMVRAHIDDATAVKTILSNPPDVPGDVFEQLAARKQIVTSKSCVRLATRLYWDVESNRMKRGAAGNGGGSARRLALILMQFDVTHDLLEVSEQRLADMLPKEFARFLREK